MQTQATTHAGAAIELSIRGLGQLFDSFDPSPFREKALDPDAHRYILSCAQESAPHVSKRLIVHLPKSLQAQTAVIVEGIHNHFRLEAEAAHRELRRRMRIGRLSLLWGLAILALCSALRELLVEASGVPLRFFSDGLVILGWVALWRPIEILLFERWQARDERRWLERLSRIPIEFAYFADPAGA
jgi:hypothetical protein